MKVEDPVDLLSLLHYEEQGVVYKDILKKRKREVIVYSIYHGEGLSCDPSPDLTLVVGLEGNANLHNDQEVFTIGPLQSFTVPANCKWNIKAVDNFKMLMVKHL